MPVAQVAESPAGKIVVSYDSIVQPFPDTQSVLAMARQLACRRSTTALAAANERRRSAPVNALPAAELGRSGCYPLPAACGAAGFPADRS